MRKSIERACAAALYLAKRTGCRPCRHREAAGRGSLSLDPPGRLSLTAGSVWKSAFTAEEPVLSHLVTRCRCRTRPRRGSGSIGKSIIAPAVGNVRLSDTWVRRTFPTAGAIIDFPIDPLPRRGRVRHRQRVTKCDEAWFLSGECRFRNRTRGEAQSAGRIKRQTAPSSRFSVTTRSRSGSLCQIKRGSAATFDQIAPPIFLAEIAQPRSIR